MSHKSDDPIETEALQIAARVRHARILKGLRMKDLAELVGYNESMISKIESGKVTPSLTMLNRIVLALYRDMASSSGCPSTRIGWCTDPVGPGRGRGRCAAGRQRGQL